MGNIDISNWTRVGNRSHDPNSIPRDRADVPDARKSKDGNRLVHSLLSRDEQTYAFPLPNTVRASARMCFRILISFAIDIQFLQKRLSTPVLLVGDLTCDSPLSFQSPNTTSPASPARVHSLSNTLLIQKHAQSVSMPSAEDACVQDEQWVALTRNLTLLPSQCRTLHEVTRSGDETEENMMVCILDAVPFLSLSFQLMTVFMPFSALQNLDELPLHSTGLLMHAQCFQYETGEQPKVHITENTTPTLVHLDSVPKVLSPRLSLPSATGIGYLQASDSMVITTPPLGTVMLPLDIREPQPSQQERQRQQVRRSRFTMGPRPDCEKCRLEVPGHYAHFD